MRKRSKGVSGRDSMRSEYDFHGGARGKYAARYREGTNIVLLEPDVARVFPNARAVNRALRALLHVVPTKRRGERTRFARRSL
jgi:hypothetical protein